MNVVVERTSSTWPAAVRLAMIVSTIAVVAALVLSTVGDVSQTAIILPVIVIAFTASWIQSGRAGRVAVIRPVPTVTARAHRQHAA